MRLASLVLLALPLSLAAQSFTDRSDLIDVAQGFGFGISLVDVDGDGRTDLLARSAFFRQTDAGFVAVALPAPEGDREALGTLVADLDRDGVREILRLNHNNVRPYRYHAARGEGVVIEQTGIEGFSTQALVQGSLLLDDDRDGRLDLFIGDDGPPDVLFRNTEAGFVDVSDALLPRRMTGTYGTAAADYDRDGDLDIYVGLCRLGDGGIENVLYRRDGDAFAEVAQTAGVDDPKPSWGVAWLDFDNDGWLDLAVANMPSDEGGASISGRNTLYRNLGDGTFADVTAAASIGGATDTDSWSVVAADFDNDGWIDLFVANRPEASILWRNRGDGTFEDVTAAAGLSNVQTLELAAGDVNGDGWIDLATRDELFLNDGGSNRWLGLRLRGTASNPDGVGARIEVAAGGQTQVREITAGDGMMAQSHALEAHVGLGTATSADVTVRWPSGTVTALAGVSTDQYVTIIEGVGLNAPPAPFDLTAPEEGATIDAAAPIVLAWEPAADTEAVTYTVTLARPDGTDRTYTTTEATVSIPQSDLVLVGEYGWAVVASDERTPRASLSRRTFSTAAVATEPAPTASGLTLVVGPNPAAGRIGVRVEGAQAAVQIEVFDAVGRLAATTRLQPSRPEADLDLPGAPAGLYVVRATSGDKIVARSVVVTE